MDPKTYKFDTLSLHGGHQPDKNFGSRAGPIYQTTSYVFQDTDHAAALFNLEQGGHIYSRISNPTVAVLEERIAALEGGTGAIATASGQSAVFLSLMTLVNAGDHIVSSSQLQNGVALLRTGRDMTLIIGPVFGGFLFVSIGVGKSYLFIIILHFSFLIVF